MDIIKPTRRGFLGLLGGLLAAPAIVRAGSLMPVKVLPPPDAYQTISVAIGPHRPFGETVVVDYLLPGIDGPRRHQIMGEVPFEKLRTGDVVDIGKVPEGARIIGARLMIGGNLGDCHAVVRDTPQHQTVIHSGGIYKQPQKPIEAFAVREGNGWFTVTKG